VPDTAGALTVGVRLGSMYDRPGTAGVPEMTGSEFKADEEAGKSIEEPGMMLMEKAGPEEADEEPGAMGRAELAIDDKSVTEGSTAPGVEQMVVVVATTVVDVRTTVALAGQSLALEHSVV
jgi:hypothetical protein